MRIERDDPVEVVLHPALLPAFQDWLDTRGLLLARLPEDLQSEDSLEAFIVTPTDEAMRRLS